jgi:signal transduction histidine kinase
MSIFFIVNDRMVKKESVSVIRDYIKGATMREIANKIEDRITDEYDADKLTKRIRSVDLVELNEMGLEVVDINVMDPSGVVIASLTGKSLYEQLDSDGLSKVMSREMRLRYPPEGYHGHWVIEYTLPHILSIPSGKKELGALQIIFSTRGIVNYSQQMRMRNLFYVGIVTIVLTAFIIPLTGYLIVRRLERLMETISAVQAGDPTARAKDSTHDEIGRLSRSFNRMIEQIQSEHASRLAALGNLAAGVAHEVRNPLNSIAMTIQYLKDTINSHTDSDAQECLDVINRQVEELDRIVEDFLRLTRPVEMNWKVVDLDEFLSDVLRDFASSLEIADVKLIRRFSEEPLYPKIDRDKLRQAISNIIINAIQSMPEGGELRVSTGRDAFQKAAIIKISDTGVGIPEENIGRLFEPYFTTKSEGTGLGLAITYRMIKSHGGDINVESSVGRGTSFTISLPFFMSKIIQNETSNIGSRR